MARLHFGYQETAINPCHLEMWEFNSLAYEWGIWVEKVELQFSDCRYDGGFAVEGINQNNSFPLSSHRD